MLFSHIVSVNFGAQGAHLNLAGALMGKGRVEQALGAALQEIEKRQRTEMDSHLVAANAYLQLGSLPQAQAHLAKAAELKPRNPDTMVTRGNLLSKRGEYEEALRAYSEVLALRPGHLQATIGTTDAYSQLGRYGDCIEAAERAEASALQHSPRLRIHLLKGRAWQRLGDFAKAERTFQSALQSTPRSVALLLAVSALRLEQERHAESIELLDRAKDVADGAPRVLLDIADKLRIEGRLAEAFEAFGELLEVDPESARGLAGLGLTLFAQARYEEAIASISRALDLDPSLGIAGTLEMHLGQAWQHLGQLEHAERHFQAAIAIDPNDTQAIDRVGLLVYQQGRFADAARWYAQLAELWPHDAQTFATFAAAQAQAGNPQEAIRTFEHALSLDPNLEAARRGLALARASAATGGG